MNIRIWQGKSKQFSASSKAPLLAEYREESKNQHEEKNVSKTQIRHHDLLTNNDFLTETDNDLLTETEPAQDSCIDKYYDCFPLPSKDTDRSHQLPFWWHRVDTCNGQLPFYQLSPLTSTRWAANTCDFFMKPVYCINQISFCCWGQGYDEACNACCNTCFYIPTFCALKTPFYALAGVASGVSWVAGKAYQSFGPEHQTMDEALNDTFENTDHKNSDHIKIQIVNCIRNNSLKNLIEFALQGNTQQKALASSYKDYGPAILCFTIAYEGNDVPFKWRKWFIKNLLRHGVSADGFKNEPRTFLPLFQALKANYHHSEEIVQLLCEHGANITSNVIPHINTQKETILVNYLVAAYLLYLKTKDPSIYKESYLVKAAILRSHLSYELPTHWFECDAELRHLHENIATIEELPSKLDAVSKVVPELKIGSTKNHEGLYNIIGQYTGAFFPKGTGIRHHNLQTRIPIMQKP